MKHRVLAVARPIVGSIAAGLLSVALAGCFGDFAPVAPSQNSGLDGRQPIRTITLSVLPSGSSKLLGDATSASKVIGPAGGKVSVEDKAAQIKASLLVPNGALSANVNIEMVMTSSGSDLVIAFSPDGLVFNAPASLELRLGDDVVDASDLTVFHEHDGVVDAATITVNQLKKIVIVDVVVPGFSRYGLAD